MKRALIIGVVALCLTALVATVANGSGGSAAQAARLTHLWQYRMDPGDTVSSSSELPGLWQLGHFDVHVVINDGPGTGHWSMDIEECCTEGNTILAIKLGVGGLRSQWATSPEVIHLGPVSVPQYRWLVVVTGYVDCPGGFPTVYYYTIRM